MFIDTHCHLSKEDYDNLFNNNDDYRRHPFCQPLFFVVAGPTGATPNKPIGMVCFGFYVNGQSYSVTKYFGEIGRNNVRNLSVAFALEFINSVI